MSEIVKVRRVNDCEMWIGENRTTLLPDLNIIHVVAVGEQTDEIANLQREIASEFFRITNGRIHFLIDLDKAGKNSPEARKTWTQLSEHEKTSKVAIFGLHPVARVLASFVIRVSNSNNQRFFKTQEDAMAWLLEE